MVEAIWEVMQKLSETSVDLIGISRKFNNDLILAGYRISC